MKARAGWWWIDRWRKSTAYTDMTLAEQGAYRNLLDELWLRGGLLPNDERILAKASGDALAWPEVRAAVLARFVTTPAGLRNLTHDEVAAGSERFSQAQSAKGKKGADARWHGRNGRTDGREDGRGHGPEHGLPSPSPSPSPEQERTEAPVPADVRAEKAIASQRVTLERRLLALSAEIAERLDRDPPAVIRELSAYKRAGGEKAGELVNGRVNPGLLSFERLEKSVADGEAWLQELQAGAASAVT